MRNLIKMDFYRLKKSKFFIGCLITVFLLSIALTALTPLVGNMVAQATTGQPLVMDPVNFSSIIENPLVSFAALFILICAVSFSFLDLSGGYIKNIAGQRKQKGDTVTSKFIVIAVMELIMMIVGLLGCILGNVIMMPIIFDAAIPAAIGTFFIKWLLMMAMTSILLFFSNGLKSKTGGIIGAVLLGTGAMSLVYMGIDTGLGALGITGFTITEFIPSQLIGAVSVASGMLVANAIIVGIVFIALFYFLTVMMFNKRDIK